ncbi:MAG: hypothetical protein RLZZ501_1905 [Pseudomonadota bacterium]
MADVEQHLREALPRLTQIGAVIRFDLDSDGSWVIDARSVPVTLAEADPDDEAEAACVIRCSSDNLIRMMEGRMDPMLGYALGKLKVVGSIGVAMKLVGAIA